MNFRREKRLRPKAMFDLVPLINIVLLLLFFFVLSGTFTVTASIPIEPAIIEAPATFEEKDVIVTLKFGTTGPDKGGAILINGKDIDAWDDLDATFGELHATAPDAVVMIRPDARVPAARLIRVLSAANSAGIERYLIAAEGGTVE